jgi:23S rRNA (adenine2030-N6)-methyltransferase
MLSYRHGFHAGNPADVVKHAVLIFCLDHLARKPKPFMYIDTHAGAGSYPLEEGFAARNREWAQGIGMLGGGLTRGGEGGVTAGRRAAAGGEGEMIRRYLEIVRTPRDRPPQGGPASLQGGPAGGGLIYPGSPLLAAALLRPGDRGRCFELHPADVSLLRAALAGDRRFQVGNEDGLTALRSLLPPASRRALIFIDPPYELKAEYQGLIAALRDSLGRFPTGLYLIWYPLLAGAARKTGDRPYGEYLMELYGGTRCRAELRFGPAPGSGGRLRGCALVLYNPPWTLKAALEEAMPVFAERLGEGSWDLDWEEG